MVGKGNRKLYTFLGCLGVLSAFLWFDKLTGTDYIEFMKWGFTALAAGLTAEHYAGPKSPA